MFKIPCQFRTHFRVEISMEDCRTHRAARATKALLAEQTSFYLRFITPVQLIFQCAICSTIQDLLDLYTTTHLTHSLQQQARPICSPTSSLQISIKVLAILVSVLSVNCLVELTVVKYSHFSYVIKLIKL